MTLGEILADGRARKGWTTRTLGAKAGVSSAMVSQLENGKVKEPSLRPIYRLAKALGISLKILAETRG